MHLAEIADNARDLDLAIRWGFGWDRGPFEIWQAAGWQPVAKWIARGYRSGQERWPPRRCRPGRLEPARTGVHGAAGLVSRRRTTSTKPRSALPVYRRQPFPDRVLGEEAKYGETIFETDGVRCWHTGDDIAIVSFKSRMHAIGDDVLDGVQQALDEAERNYMGLVIWQTEPPFSVGANLKKTSGGRRASRRSPPRVGQALQAVPARGGIARVEGGAAASASPTS